MAPDVRLNAEARLLLCWARPEPSAAALACADDLLDSPIDWDRLSRYALRHRLAPLVARRVELDGRIPAEVREGLAALHRANALRNLRMAGELTLLLKAFHGKGLRAASLKGPALAQQADGCSGLRIISDLDLLISPADVDAARALLEERGYRLAGTFLFSHKDDIFTRASDASVVELHRALHDHGLPLPLSLPDLLGRLETVPLLSADIPVLPLEENLLYLAYHGAKHGWSRLAWLTALLNLMDARRDRIDADRLHRRAKDLGVEKMLALALHLGTRYLGFEAERCSAAQVSHADPGFAEELLAASFEELPRGQTLPAAELLAFATSVLGGSARTPAGRPMSTSAIDALLRQPRADAGLRRAALIRGVGGKPLAQLAHKLFDATPADVRLFGVRRERRLFYAAVRPPWLLLRVLLRRAARRRGRRIAQ